VADRYVSTADSQAMTWLHVLKLLAMLIMVLVYVSSVGLLNIRSISVKSNFHKVGCLVLSIFIL